MNKKNYTSAILDVITGLSQLMIIGLRGKDIPLYERIMSGTVILSGTLALLIEIIK